PKKWGGIGSTNLKSSRTKRRVPPKPPNPRPRRSDPRQKLTKDLAFAGITAAESGGDRTHADFQLQARAEAAGRALYVGGGDAACGVNAQNSAVQARGIVYEPRQGEQ